MIDELLIGLISQPPPTPDAHREPRALSPLPRRCVGLRGTHHWSFRGWWSRCSQQQAPSPRPKASTEHARSPLGPTQPPTVPKPPAVGWRPLLFPLEGGGLEVHRSRPSRAPLLECSQVPRCLGGSHCVGSAGLEDGVVAAPGGSRVKEVGTRSHLLKLLTPFPSLPPGRRLEETER